MYCECIFPECITYLAHFEKAAKMSPTTSMKATHSILPQPPSSSSTFSGSVETTVVVVGASVNAASSFSKTTVSLMPPAVAAVALTPAVVAVALTLAAVAAVVLETASLSMASVALVTL
jgi:hypothetical protein